ncbi:MAG: hypothetical protein KKB34_16660 [Bacteroidetes bacterium]|nr:hypothetical protein [Bacteroidota bacterium]
MNTDKFSWWSELRHGGMIISPAVLKEIFHKGYLEPSRYDYQYLRDNYIKFERWWDNPERSQTKLDKLHNWLDIVLERFLKLNSLQWRKGNEISNEQVHHTIIGENIKPNRLFYRTASDEIPSLALFVDPGTKLGFGKSKKQYGKVLEYLRGKKIKLALFTNGMTFRLCYAGLDHDSYVEWDAANWFSEGEYLPQLYGFYYLLGREGFYERDNCTFPLIEAIESSRTRQGELSSILGEQVRQAIEIILDEFGKSKKKHNNFIDSIKNNPDGTSINDDTVLSAIFQSSVRLVMRLVVILFAEARDLLPRTNELYHKHYGLEGLFEQLRKAKTIESSEFMDDLSSGWLRTLSLFKIIYLGSPHQDLQVPAYGGELFESGNPQSYDPVKRALALFEDPRFEISNSSLLKILEKLKYGKLKIKQGRSSTFMKGPVDFRELRTEFIGMIYEGILDYELKAANEPMLIINAGMQPILPLSVLEGLSEKQIKDLFDKLKQKDKKKDDEEESEEETNDEINSESEDIDENDDIDNEVDNDTTDESDNSDEILEDETTTRAQLWAEKTVECLGLVKRPRNKDENYTYEIKKRERAKNLLKEVYETGDYYISRWGGTRKGTGTFYTRPQLAIPTVIRTLEPLCYTESAEKEYEVVEIPESTSVSEPAAKYSSKIKLPKQPEEILSVKVCDPACGSGSFLVAALNYLTDALYESLIYHANMLNAKEANRITLPLGIVTDDPLDKNVLPCLPDEDDFEIRTKAKLKRHVVENCIYGVDLNSTAVELARLSLWIETMDRNLPFEFLDHKIKTGNSLVGAWLDTFQEYPLAAWLREGGDKNHTTEIHYEKETWTKAIKKRFNDVIKPEMVEVILLRAGQMKLDFIEDIGDPIEDHKKITEQYNELHKPDLSIFGLEQKAKLYNELLTSESYKNIKDRMDIWCSIWFWTGDKIEQCPTPKTFYKPETASLEIAKQISEQFKFFHWEIEFPDVFNPHSSGFDAVVGNPPWEISKPNSKEFFSNLDPIYRTYGKQEALKHQERLFDSNEEIEYNWLSYNAYFKGMSNYVKNAAYPFGDPEGNEDNKISLARGKKNFEYHNMWRLKRDLHKCFATDEHPFRYQGSADLNTYKMYLEYSYAVLHEKGRLGMIVPSGIYSDKGTQGLRNLFINKSKWEWLYSFENKNKIFDIHRSFKFNPIIIQKGKETDQIKTAFMKHNVIDWEEAKDFISYNKEQIIFYSPKSYAILELKFLEDLRIVDKIYKDSVLLGDNSNLEWKLDYSTELHMTGDSSCFVKRTKLENQNYIVNEYGTMIDGKRTIYLPLYEGKMIGQFDYSNKKWIRGDGRSAIWEKLDFPKTFNSRYYVSIDDYKNVATHHLLKLAFNDITTSVHHRTMFSALVPRFPCSHLVPVFTSVNINLLPSLCSIFNSFVYDFIVRRKIGYLHLSYFILEETPLVLKSKIPYAADLISYSLSCNHISFAEDWIRLSQASPNLKLKNWLSLWAITPHERLRLRCILDAIVAELYGLDYEDFAWILRDDPTDPKGFWRVDKDKPKELRQTTLTLQAFKRLKEVGLDEFIKEDWQFPKHIQEQLGPRFLDWQLEGTPEESWKECEYHAKQILGEEGFKNFIDELENGKTEENVVKEKTGKYGKDEEMIDLFRKKDQIDLF